MTTSILTTYEPLKSRLRLFFYTSLKRLTAYFGMATVIGVVARETPTLRVGANHA
jgi:hypothetical protein